MIIRTPYLIALATIVAATFVVNGIAHSQAVPVRRPLQTLPLKVQDWNGQTAFLDPEILGIVGADDYVLRRYQAPTGGPLWLYVAYYAAQRLGNNRVHSPAVCLPGAGWSIARSETTPIRLADGTIVVNSNVVRKGDQSQLVLYWYQIQKRAVAKELHAVTFLAWTSLFQHRTNEALVRVSAPIVGTVQDTLQAEVAFIQAATPLLEQILPY